MVLIKPNFRSDIIKNIELILEYIKNKASLDNLLVDFKDDKILGVDAMDIQDNLGIVRNNGSNFLNELFKQKKLIKINSRPVTYIPKEVMLQIVDEKDLKDAYGKDEIQNIISMYLNEINMSDPFDVLIGKDNSLSIQIEQAKAAIMYPTNGLNTLIFGESGVGKTTFANTMYKFGKESKGSSEDEFPFISFNCSDYFNNPQLLLSQLFGHAKGAFTGADSDKVGIVEKADGGILFLDEVHRLPSDGQEMLFYLMDKGEYHRLGEAGKKRKSNILIIAATTENPDGILLSTFLRRFPVIITLPPYRDKNISEKVEIIEELFCSEAANTDKPIKIAAEVIKALALYEFRIGNIGELHSEIKLLCAKAYLEFLKRKDELIVEFKMLSIGIRDNFLMDRNIDSATKTYLDIFSDYLMIYPELANNNFPEHSNKDIYEFIDRKINDLKTKGLAQEQIDKKLNLEIEYYFDNMLKTSDLSKLYKIIPQNIVDFSAELINIAENDMDAKLNSRLILGLAFHLDALLKRLKSNEMDGNTIINKMEIKTKHPNEYKTATKLVLEIEEKFDCKVPENEKVFIAILLANSKNNKINTERVGIITVCHGDTTATSIAGVANTLFNTNIVKAIDMPLDSTISETYNKIKVAAQSLNMGKGILLFVDMGSLTNLGDKLMNETGIKVKTFSNVSTLHVLDAARIVLYKGGTLEEIYDSITNHDFSTNNAEKTKKKAILTVCASGEGTGKMLKEMILKILTKDYENQIEVISLDYINSKSIIDQLMDQYDIIAYCGTIDLDIAVPYFPMSKFLRSDFQSEFLNFVDININGANGLKGKENAYTTAKKLLEKNVKYVNPEMAIFIIKEFIEDLHLDIDDDKKENLIDLIVHLGCMLNRCIHGDKVIFAEIEEFKEKNSKGFRKIRKSIKKMEEEFEISINDDEVCYILTILNIYDFKL